MGAFIALSCTFLLELELGCCSCGILEVGDNLALATAIAEGNHLPEFHRISTLTLTLRKIQLRALDADNDKLKNRVRVWVGVYKIYFFGITKPFRRQTDG